MFIQAFSPIHVIAGACGRQEVEADSSRSLGTPAGHRLSVPALRGYWQRRHQRVGLGGSAGMGL